MSFILPYQKRTYKDDKYHLIAFFLYTKLLDLMLNVYTICQLT